MKLLTQLLEALNKHAILEFQSLLLDNELIHHLDVRIEYHVNDRGAQDESEVIFHVDHLAPGEFIDCQLFYSEKKGFGYLYENGNVLRLGQDAQHAISQCMPWLIGKKLSDELEELPNVAYVCINADIDNSLELQVLPKGHGPDDASILHQLAFEWDTSKQAFVLIKVGDLQTWEFSDHDPDLNRVFKSVDAVVDFVSKRLDESAK